MHKKLNQSFLDLVSYLNDGQYHDGNSLGDALGVSRTAIWKMIKKLETYDIEVESIKGKGYQLKNPLMLLDRDVCINIQITINVTPILEIDNKNNIFTND